MKKTEQFFILFLSFISFDIFATCLHFEDCLGEFQSFNSSIQTFSIPCRPTFQLSLTDLYQKRYSSIEFNSSRSEDIQTLELSADTEEMETFKADLEQLQSEGKHIIVMAEQANEPDSEFLVTRKQDPKNWELVLIGVAAAPVEFMLHTTLHEASHALVLKLGGADIKSFKPYPHRSGSQFYFGSVSYIESEDQKYSLLADAAPMLLDASMITTYATLAATGKLPKNKLAQLGIWTLSAGATVDLGTHMLGSRENSDSNRLIQSILEETKLAEKGSTLLVRGSQGLFVAAGTTSLAMGLHKLLSSGSSSKSSSSATAEDPDSSDSPIFQDITLIPDFSPSKKRVMFTLRGSF